MSAELDQQLRGVAPCATNDKGELDMTCPGARSFVDWSNKNKAWLDANAVEVSDVTRAHLAAEAPATRSVAIRLVALGVKAGLPGSRADLAARMPLEKDAGLRLQIVKMAAGGDGELRELVVRALGDEAPQVRMAALRALAKSGKPPAPGAERDAWLAVLGGDPSAEVRQVACMHLDVGNDEALLTALGKVLDDPATSADLFGWCFERLVYSWASERVAQPSAAAYEQTLKRLETGPRDAAHPLSLGIGAIGFLRGKAREPPSFFQEERVVKALRAIGADAQALEATRAAAIGAQLALNPGQRPDLGIPWEEASAIVERAASSQRAGAPAADAPDAGVTP